MSSLTALLPSLSFPHAHEGALRAFQRFCATLRPRLVVQTGRLFATVHPGRADLDRAARWLCGLGDCPNLVLVTTPTELEPVSEAIRIAGTDNATPAETEYRLPGSSWIAHRGVESGNSAARFPGSAAIGLAHRKQTNILCGHTGLRGIMTEIQETNSTPVERSGMELGHLSTAPTRTDNLGFGILLADTTLVRPALVRVGRDGAIRYGGARFTP